MVGATNRLCESPGCFGSPIAPTEEDVREAIVTGNFTSSSSRAVIEDVQVIFEDPVESFCRHGSLEIEVDTTFESCL